MTTKPNAAARAFVTARSDLAAQIAELQKMMTYYHGATEAEMTWPAVGDVSATTIALREITDRFFKRGEYAVDA